MDLTQLKAKLRDLEAYDFVTETILQGHCKHISEDQIEHIRNSITKATGIEIHRNEIYVVGSAKIGFGLFEKKRKDEITLPAFREFGPLSDIDIAFASPSLFDAIWSELNSYALNQPWMPFRMKKLGDYMIYGWIRPDQMPKNIRLHLYDRWNDQMAMLSTQAIFNRRKITGALYRNVEFVAKYQTRGINKCKKSLELT